VQTQTCEHSSNSIVQKSSRRVESFGLATCDETGSAPTANRERVDRNTCVDTANNEVTGPVILISVIEAARTLGISRSHAYELIARGAIASVRLGRRVLVPTAEIQRLARPNGATHLGEEAESSRSSSRTRPNVDATGVSADCTACA
jgi:excisionase family DNA binding protein